MGRHKKEVELTSATQINNKDISTEQKVELVGLTTDTIVEKAKEITIFDKYRNLINMANSNYLNGYQYSDLMVILRYCEKEYDHPIPMNLQCGNCVIELVKMFGRLENK